MIQPSQLLRRALLADAIFSGVSAVSDQPAPAQPSVLVPYSRFQEIQRSRRPAAGDASEPIQSPAAPVEVLDALESPTAAAGLTSRAFGVVVVED